MSEKTRVKIVIGLDEDNNAFVCMADDDVAEQVGEHANNHGTAAMRLVRLTAFITPPKPVEVDVPDEEDDTVEVVEAE